MIRYNLIGGPFQHAHSSTWWKKSKYIEWNKNDYRENVTFYVDDGIYSGLRDNVKGKKYAWNLESKEIFSTDFIFNNIDEILNKFDLIFTMNRDLININPEKIKFVPGMGAWIENPKIYDKSKLISMISSTKGSTYGQNVRLKFISENRNKFDLFGRGFNEIKLKEDGLIDYMFSVAIENAKYNDYFTEKILDCFATGTIPIYFGTNNISNYFNSNGIIKLDELNFDDLTPDLYYSKMKYIQENFEKVLEMNVLEDYIYKKYLSNE